MELSEIFRKLLDGKEVKLAVYSKKEGAAKLVVKVNKVSVMNGLSGFNDNEVKRIKYLVRRKKRDSDWEVQNCFRQGCRADSKITVRKDVYAKRVKEYGGWNQLDNLISEIK